MAENRDGRERGEMEGREGEGSRRDGERTGGVNCARLTFSNLGLIKFRIIFSMSRDFS